MQLSEQEILELLFEKRKECIDAKSGIYAFIYLPKNKWYVGSAINFKERWKGHHKDLLKHKHHSYKLNMDCKQYNPYDFMYIILEKVENIEELVSREQYWLDYLRAAELGYNILKVADSPLGLKHSEETKQKISAALKKSGHKPSEYCMQRMKEERKTHIFTEEERRARSERMKGRKLTDEHKEKIGAHFRGQTLTEEHKAKLSASKKGRKFSDEHKAKLSKPRGTPKSVPRHIIAKVKYALLNRNGRTNKQIAEEFGIPVYIITNIVTKNQYSSVEPSIN